MYFKIRNPANQSAKTYLAISSGLMAGYVLLAMPFLFNYRSNIGLAITKILADVEKAFQESLCDGLTESVVYFGIPAFFVWSIWKYFHTCVLRNDHNFIKALDFQENCLILRSEEPIALAYAETDFEMVIFIRVIYLGRGQYKFAYHLTLLFHPTDHKGKGKKIFRLEHAAKLEDIFRLVDLKPLFHDFTYDIQTEGYAFGFYDPHKQSNFISEQINNQLNYGVHLPFRKELVIDHFLLLLVGLFVGGLLIWLMHVLPLVAFLLVCAFGCYMGSIVRKLWQYFKASKIIKSYQLTENLSCKKESTKHT